MDVSLKLGMANAEKEAIADGLMFVEGVCDGVRGVPDAVALRVNDRVADTLPVRVCVRV